MVNTDPNSQAGYTLLVNEPVIVEDLENETRFNAPPLLVDHHVVSGISVVIGSKEQPFGVLGAHTTRQRAFSEDDVHFFQSVAHILAEAIRQNRSEEVLRRHLSELEAVNRISISLRTAKTIPEMMPILLDEILAATGSEAGCIWLRQPNKVEFNIAAADGWCEKLSELQIESTHGTSGKVFSQGKMYRSNEFCSDPVLENHPLHLAPCGWGGICLTILAADEIVGQLIVSVPSSLEIKDDVINLLRFPRRYGRYSNPPYAPAR